MGDPLAGMVSGRVGPYRIVRRLGAGGMGVVYLGYDDSGTAAAVKLIRPEYVAETVFRDRLRREVAAARRVPRFCTAPVLDADVDAEPPWVATEYVDAPALDVVLLERGRLRGDPLLALAVGVAVALRAIHQHGVIHRDLKPSNILLSRNGPRVIDFGIARVDDAGTRLTRTGGVVGTPAFMAPEQLRGDDATPAVDVFAWAGLVTCAATGRPPFGAGAGVMDAILFGSPDLGDLAEPLRGLVTAAFDRDPGRRPTAAELVDRLSRNPSALTTQVLVAAATPTIVAGRRPGAGAGSTVRGRFAPTVRGRFAPTVRGRFAPARRRPRRLVSALAATLAVAGGATTGLLLSTGDTTAGEKPGGGDGAAAVAQFEAGTTMAKLAAAGTIRVGTSFELPGFGLAGMNGVPEGFDAEIARMISAELGVPENRIQWVRAPARDREALLERGEVDLVVATYTITDSRKERVDFAGPYYVGGQQIMVRAGETEISGPTSFSNGTGRVCAVRGTTPSQVIRQYLASDDQLTLLDRYPECVSAMAAGIVDAVTADDVTLIGLTLGDPERFRLVEQAFTGDPFTQYEYGIGLRKGDDAFRDWINDVLEKIAADGRYRTAWQETAGRAARTVPDPPPVDRYDSG